MPLLWLMLLLQPAPSTAPAGVTHADHEPATPLVSQPGDWIAVHYTGKLVDGTVFDTSLKPRGRTATSVEPFAFVLGQGRVIAGWDEGLIGMKVGDRRTLTIPPDKAYGERGSPPRIPPNATLVFEVEVVGLSRPPVQTP
jgi:FKBP-type peptidyl-prolyl cis-trans isomerase